MAIVTNYPVGGIDYYFDPSPLKNILGDRNNISSKLIFHPNQPVPDAEPRVGFHMFHELYEHGVTTKAIDATIGFQATEH